MSRKTILKQLAKTHPACLCEHPDIKAITPIKVLQTLLDNGYTDVSYGNDECPSYLVEKTDGEGGVWESIIYLYDDVNDNGERISNTIKFNVINDGLDFTISAGVFETIEEAIAASANNDGAQYITNSRNVFFVVQNATPLDHEELKVHPTYEYMIDHVYKTSEQDYKDLLHLEITVTWNQNHQSFHVTYDRGFTKTYTKDDLVGFLVDYII
tara:strand:- start:2470 stop:3105 length:636 start_codon:yes stop_codon:yes gene_type:complete